MGVGFSSVNMNNIMRINEFASSEKALGEASGKEPGSLDDEQLKNACSEFEKIFIQMMYKCMKDTVQKSELVPRGMATDIYESMLDEKLMEEVSRTGSFGLANALYRQLEK